MSVDRLERLDIARPGVRPQRNVGPCLREPPVELTVVGLEARDRTPEPLRMVEREQMTELVNQQIAHYRRIDEQQSRVEADVGGARAASPARALQTDLDAL